MTGEPPAPAMEVTEVAGSIAILRFTRPTERNPLSIVTLSELRSAFSMMMVREDTLLSPATSGLLPRRLCFLIRAQNSASLQVGAERRECRDRSPFKGLSFLLTAGRYSSEEVLDIGLISGVTDPVLGAALKLAQQRQKKGAELQPGAS